MKKITASLLALIMIMIFVNEGVYSVQARLTTVSGMKLFMDGRPLKLKNALLSLNGAILVPAAEFAAGSGLAASGKYYKWDAKKKTATLCFGNVTMVFRQGSSKATVNGRITAMESPCISYAGNRKVYIPLKFTSQALGRLIVADTGVNTLYISDKGTYEKNLKRLNVIDKAIQQADKMQVESNMKLALEGNGSRAEVSIKLKDELDRSKMILLSTQTINLFGGIVETRNFYADNSVYTWKSADGSWTASPMKAEDFRRALVDDYCLGAINKKEVLAASMRESTSTIPGTFVLAGYACPVRLVEMITSNAGLKRLEADTFHIEGVIDPVTNQLRELKIDTAGDCDSTAGFTRAEAVIDMSYAFPGTEYEIPVPEDLNQK